MLLELERYLLFLLAGLTGVEKIGDSEGGGQELGLLVPPWSKLTGDTVLPLYS